MIYTLAIDIERSGALPEHNTIGIGMSVVDENFKELDSLFLPGYNPKDCNMEQKCWDEFWSKNEDTLNKLLHPNDSISSSDIEKQMIISVQEFRKKWETICNNSSHVLHLVSDNNVYDGGFINQLIFKYTDDMPIPYKVVDKSYNSFFETHSEQRGFLLAVDHEFNSNWGFTKRISDLYNVPVMNKLHDHNPANDAYTIAFDHQVLNNIRSGNIKKR
jgi:hypothetical protein